jgi:molecular chaperone DnaK
VLIDVATHTLGTSALEGDGYGRTLVFVPIIRRNTPLPATFEEIFVTISEDQKKVDVDVFQGESAQLNRNKCIGRFVLDGLNENDNSDGRILVRFDLTLDGTLTVTATERKSGITQTIKVDNALAQMSEEGRVEREERMESLFSESIGFGSMDASSIEDVSIEVNLADEDERPNSSEWHLPNESESSIRIDGPEVPEFRSQSKLLISKAKAMRSSVSNDDANDIDRLVGLIEDAEQKDAGEMLDGLYVELEDLLFYLA